jgi:hypothetical protein
MRGPDRDVAIDLRAECCVLALAASQHRVDEACGARVPHLPRRLDRFGHGGVRRNFRVQELTQSDDREPAAHRDRASDRDRASRRSSIASSRKYQRMLS